MSGVEFNKTLKDLNLQIFKVVSKRHKILGIDLTPIQGNIILKIYENKEILCQKHLESFLSCNKSTLSSILDTMEKKELIKRVVDTEDTRKNVILLTDKSKKIISIISNDHDIFEKLMLKGIKKEEQEIAINVLNQIKLNLERM